MLRIEPLKHSSEVIEDLKQSTEGRADHFNHLQRRAFIGMSGRSPDRVQVVPTIDGHARRTTFAVAQIAAQGRGALLRFPGATSGWRSLLAAHRAGGVVASCGQHSQQVSIGQMSVQAFAAMARQQSGNDGRAPSAVWASRIVHSVIALTMPGLSRASVNGVNPGKSRTVGESWQWATRIA